MINKFSLLTIALSFFSFVTYAGGFQLNQQGHKATGMGGAFVGTADRPTTAFYNPAGMNRLNGHNFNAGLTLISPHVSVQTSVYDNIDATSGLSNPIQFYYVGEFTDKIRVGLSINNQFGSSSSFEDDWQGKYVVQNISLKTYMFQPTFSYQITDWISVGAGFVYTLGSFSYEKAVPLSSEDQLYGKASLEGSGNSMGFNAGLHSEFYTLDVNGANLTFSAGATYRSEQELQLTSGTARFTEIPPSLHGTFPEETSFTSGLSLPAVLNGGINIKYKKEDLYSIELAYDINNTFWSSYDTLSFDFKNEDTPDSKTPKNWEDVLTHRVGLDFTYKDFISLRVGAYMDNTPIPQGFVSPELPDNDHIGYTAGIGVKLFDQLSIDISYLRSEFFRKEASLDSQGFQADYHRIVNVFGFGVNYQFFCKKEKSKASIE